METSVSGLFPFVCFHQPVVIEVHSIEKLFKYNLSSLPDYFFPPGHLFCAIEDDDVGVVADHIENKNVDPNLCNDNGFALLHVACNYNSISVAKYLIDKGANVNAENSTVTILHSACGKGSYEMIALLLQNGADPKALTKNKQLPLQWLNKDHLDYKNNVILMYLSGGGIDLGKTLLDAVIGMTDQNDDDVIVKESLLEKASLNLASSSLAYFELPTEVFRTVTSVDLSKNLFKIFPRHLLELNTLVELNLSYNFIETLPSDICKCLPKLQTLDVSYNKIDEIPAAIADINKLELNGNPLASIPAVFRTDKRKLLFYSKYTGKREPWNRLKLMLVGHEGVGKTTFVKSLQGQQAPASKNLNISTNGVDITQVEIPYVSNEGTTIMRLNKKQEKIECRVWDFGGQTVFHSTHRFFLTASAVYLVVFNMTDEKTHSRLHSIVDSGGSMPTLIVGTHADKLSKSDQEQVMKKIASAYPISKSNTGVQGHFAVSLKNDHGIQDLKAAIVKIARGHPQIGIGKVLVPSFLILVKEKIEGLLKQNINYLTWNEYKDMCHEENIPIVEWTLILQDLGILIWNNTAKLRNVVVINPQWLADALAGVVTMVNQEAVARTGGVVHRSRLYSAMKNKIADSALYPVIFGFLERFEIILKLRNYYLGLNVIGETHFSSKRDSMNLKPTNVRIGANRKSFIASNPHSTNQVAEYKYFVPSLLLPYDPVKDLAHSAIQFWVKVQSKKTYTSLKRRYTWANFPAGFFPRLLLRLMHVQMSLLGSWVDAAVLMSQDQHHFSFMHLYPKNDKFVLEVTVLQDNHKNTIEPLISTLSYTITRLDTDMWEGTPVTHDVIIATNSESGEDKCITTEVQETVIPFSDCIAAVAKNQMNMELNGQKINLISITPDLSSSTEIPITSILEKKQIATGGFGVVYKAVMKETESGAERTVAIKELKQDSEDGMAEKLLEFQHEMLITSKLVHKNLVQLYGVILSPLSMVIEFIPCGDLHKLTCRKRFVTVGLKWRLKMAIDIARGMSYLHKQTPPICHSDLRAPNIFVASLDEGAEVVGKVADFGLARQVFPFSTQILGNLVETAPETWGDEGTTKGAMYDERSDVFSYAIILWQLFGCKALSFSPETINGEGEDNEHVGEADPYEHLRDSKGRPLNKWSLRDKIREGARPKICADCPVSIKQVMEECWRSNANYRPYFPIITQSLETFYASKFGNDKYLNLRTSSNSTSTIIPVPISLLNSKREFSPVIFHMKNWEPKPQINSENWSIVSLLIVDKKLWAGTNTGAILTVDPETGKVDHLIALKKQGRVALVQAGPACIWASCETDKICVIHTQTNYKIIEIDNQAPITCMQVCYHHAGPAAPIVWVADTKGCISLWDVSTLQKYCQFQVIDDPLVYGNMPPVVRSMSGLNDYMWLAVGGDVVVFETQTLQKAVRSSGSGRLNCITTVPSTQQAWTCSKDGWMMVWQFKKQAQAIELVSSFQVETEVKSVHPLTSHFPHLCHVISGDFDGKLTLWNSEALGKPKFFPMPPESESHSIHCALDAGELGLWVGLMNADNPLLRYNWYDPSR